MQSAAKAKPTRAAAAAAASKSSTATKAAVALIAASNVLRTAASVLDNSTRNFELERALDSGAGEDLSSMNAFAKQGVLVRLNPGWLKSGFPVLG